MDRIRIIKHEAVPKSVGSYEVRFPYGRPLKFFYWEDDPTRHLWPDAVGSEQALQDARSFAQAEQDKLNQR